MFTWILLAIVVAALFGFINFDKVRYWLLTRGKDLWPHAQKYVNVAQEKIKEFQNHMEEQKNDELEATKKTSQK